MKQYIARELRRAHRRIAAWRMEIRVGFEIAYAAVQPTHLLQMPVLPAGAASDAVVQYSYVWSVSSPLIDLSQNLAAPNSAALILPRLRLSVELASASVISFALAITFSPVNGLGISSRRTSWPRSKGLWP